MEDLKKKLRTYLDNNLVQEKTFKIGLFNKFKRTYMSECCSVDFENDSSYKMQKLSKKETSNIKDFFNEHEQYSDFQTMLFKLIDDRNLKDSDVYNKVHIDRRLFSKIRSDKNKSGKERWKDLLRIVW